MAELVANRGRHCGDRGDDLISSTDTVPLPASLGSAVRITTVAEFSADERPPGAGLPSLPPRSVNWSDSNVAHDGPKK